MASASHVSLSRLLLRRSDQHPVRIVDGHDLRGHPPETVREFIRLGILVERETPTDMDGFAIQRVGERTIMAHIDGDILSAEVAPECMRQYDVDLLALCQQIRSVSGLEGRSVEAVTPRAYWLGARGSGSRRTEYYVVRRLRADTALDTVFALKARSNGLAVGVLTPTERDLPGSIRRQLGAEQITVAAVEALLDANSAEPLRITIPVTTAGSGAPPQSARLIVDVQGAAARFDGALILLARREFLVLVRLANERVNEDGLVRRDDVADTICDATGRADRNPEQIDKIISNLRKALSRAGATTDGGRSVIESRRNLGYRLLIPVDSIFVF